MSADATLNQFITEHFLHGEAALAPAADESLVGSGVIDSPGVLELVLFLEQEFGVEVLDEDLVPENLDSVNRLVAYLETKHAIKKG